MADSRRLTRGAKISYAESSESSDGESDSMYISNAQDSVPPTNQRKERSLHKPLSTIPQRSTRPSAQSSMRRPKPRAKRSNHRQSYKESTSSETSDDDVMLRTPKRRKIKASAVTDTPTPSKLKQSSRSPRASTYESSQPIESDGKVPDWQSLPYEIILSIFRYAIQSSSVNWATQVARICKTFSEPVLTALYESPPLHFLDSPFGLLNLLNASRYKTMNYQVKIKSLHMVAKQTLAYSAPGRGLFPLTDLLVALPQLQGLDISGPRDRPPFFTTTNHGAWNYPKETFTSMSSAGMKLKHLHINGDMLQSADGKLAACSQFFCFSMISRDLRSRLTCVMPSPSPSRYRVKYQNLNFRILGMFQLISNRATLLRSSFVGARTLEEAFTQTCLHGLEHLKLSNIILDRAHDIPKRQYPSIWPTALAQLRELRSLGLHSVGYVFAGKRRSIIILSLFSEYC